MNFWSGFGMKLIISLMAFGFSIGALAIAISIWFS